MKIALIWWFDKASSVYDNWRDGVRGAMDVIGENHKVGWYLDKTMPDPNSVDVLLFWSSSEEDYFDLLERYPNEKKALLLTTNPRNLNNLRKLDVIFCESQVVYDEVRMHGLHAVKAFGTDIDFFKPGKVKKDVEYFYPATFSPWKRQGEIAYLGKDLLCVGTIQPDGKEEYEVCKKAGVQIKEGYFPVKKIRDYYQRTKNIIIPAVHGSERTVLEAMSCNILPTVIHKRENAKAQTYLDEYKNSRCKTPREFVIKNYSHYIYAKKILEGIED